MHAGRQGPVDRLTEIKKRIHRQLLQRLNLSNLDGRSREEAAGQIRPEINALLSAETEALNLEDRESLIQQILDEIFGLGPLEPLMHDADISDIIVNGPKRVYIEKRGKLFETDVAFQDVAHLRQVIDRIVSNVGRRIDDSSPMVDARLPDGSRVNAVIQPVALDGPYLSIRKFKRDTLSGEDLLRANSITEPMLQLLDGVVKARLNVLISGGTGAGKTTLLNILSASIPRMRASSRSRIRPSCSSGSRTCGAWRRARRTLMVAARSHSATWSSTRCACVRTASSSARSAARRRSTCCRP
jgi:pilus assembly protein CpaF